MDQFSQYIDNFNFAVYHTRSSFSVLVVVSEKGKMKIYLQLAVSITICYVLEARPQQGIDLESKGKIFFKFEDQ